jgi:hypothetical protein
MCAEGQSSPARVKFALSARAELTGPLRRPPLLLPPAGDPGEGRRRLLPPVHHTARAPPPQIPAAASAPSHPPASSGRVAPVGHRGEPQLLRMGPRGQPMEKGRRSCTRSGGSYDFQLPPSGRAPVTGNRTASLPNPFLDLFGTAPRKTALGAAGGAVPNGALFRLCLAGLQLRFTSGSS